MGYPSQIQPLALVFGLACRVVAHTRVSKLLNYFTTLTIRRLLYKNKEVFETLSHILNHRQHELTTRAVDRVAFLYYYYF